MNYEELLEIVKNSDGRFTRETVIDLLNKAYSSKKLDKENILDVVSAKPEAASPLYDADYKEFFYNVLPNAIIDIDPNQAIFLGDILENELLVHEHYYNNTAEAKEDVLRFKNAIMNGKKDQAGNVVYPGVNYVAPDNSRYALLASDVLFPNIEEFRNNEPIEHEIVLNATCMDYIAILNKVFKEFVDKKIPFNLRVRKPGNMMYGYRDPISIYTSAKHINDVLAIVEDVRKEYEEVLLPPSDTVANIQDKFGYTSVDKETEKTAYEEIADIITKTVDQELDDFNEHNPGVLDEVKRNWLSRAMNLQIVRNQDNKYYQDMVDHIVQYIDQMKINRTNMFLPLEMSYQYVDRMGIVDNADRAATAVDEQLSRLMKEQENDMNTVAPQEPTPAVPQEPVVQTQPVEPVQPAMPEAPVAPTEPVVTAAPQEPVAQEPVQPVQPEPVNQFNIPMAFEPVIPDLTAANDVSQVKPIDLGAPAAQPDDQLTQVFEVKGGDQPEPTLDNEDEEEKVSMNTGSYNLEPIKVTKLDSDEEKSIIASNQQDLEQPVIDLGEYAGLITPAEALSDVINSNGEHVTLIDYLRAGHVSEVIPFDSQVVTNENTTIDGKTFVKDILIPIVVFNSNDVAYSPQEILNMYARDIHYAEEPKKESWIDRLKTLGKK